MSRMPTLLMIDAQHFDVSYSINPWMQPGRWAEDPAGFRRRAIDASCQLQSALHRAGCHVEVLNGVAGLPDMVFTANAAVVLDGKALLARFRYPQRGGEEALFEKIFKALRKQGLLSEIVHLPKGVFQEGAGDCIWDASRGHFWAGFGPRSSVESIDVLAATFGREVVALELSSDRCYHLDVGFLPLSGGEILYLPDALTPAAQATLRERVPADMLIEASEEDLLNFNINAVNVGRTVITSRAAPSLRRLLGQRGYELVEVDLAPFMMSGGGAYCMTLRLDRVSDPALLAPSGASAGASAGAGATA